MVDHIYGRANLLNHIYRPHMFVNELKMYVDYWQNLVKAQLVPVADKQQKYIQAFRDNLLQGIAYYQQLAPVIFTDEADQCRLQAQLAQCQEALLAG